VIRMLAFAAGTLRGTVLAPGAYRGAHRGGPVKTIRWLAAGLLILGVLLCVPLYLLAWEGYIIDQLITGASVAIGATLALNSLVLFTAIRAFRIRQRRHNAATGRWNTTVASWYTGGKVAAGAGLLARAIPGQAGGGHPLLFAITGYCGYAISAACLGVAVVVVVRTVRHELAAMTS
jgi:hypothetical protein